MKWLGNRLSVLLPVAILVACQEGVTEPDGPSGVQEPAFSSVSTAGPSWLEPLLADLSDLEAAIVTAHHAGEIPEFSVTKRLLEELVKVYEPLWLSSHKYDGRPDAKNVLDAWIVFVQHGIDSGLIKPLAGSELVIRAQQVLAAHLGGEPPIVRFDNTDATATWISTGDLNPSTGFGQVVIVDALNPVLRRFSFWVAGWQPDVAFAAYVVRLDELGGQISGDQTSATQTVIWSSQVVGPITFPTLFPDQRNYGPAPLSDYERVTFSPNLNLDPSSAYAAYVQAIDLRPDRTFEGLHVARRIRTREGLTVTADDAYIFRASSPEGSSVAHNQETAFVAEFGSATPEASR